MESWEAREMASLVASLEERIKELESYLVMRGQSVRELEGKLEVARKELEKCATRFNALFLWFQNQDVVKFSSASEIEIREVLKKLGKEPLLIPEEVPLEPEKESG